MSTLKHFCIWEIKDSHDYVSRFGNMDSKYAKFHNLNE